MGDAPEQGDAGFFISAEGWDELCERGNFRCELCKDFPPVQDVDVFIDWGLCAACAAAEKRWALDWEEQEKLLAVAPPRIRVLTVLGVETGMRTGEMTNLRWEDVDFLHDSLRVVKSKSMAGIRAVPLSAFAKAGLLQWRSLVGPEFSDWVFPAFSNRRHKLQGGRKAWASTLRKAGIPFFPIYYLRHAFASRATAAGVSPITIAALLGHATTQVVPRYSVILDENRFDAIKKLEAFRQSSIANATAPTPDQPSEQTLRQMDQRKG
jgi:integrase